MIAELETLLLNRWTSLLPTQDRPRRVRIAALATSREAAGTRILLVFADGERAPRMVAKVPRQPKAIEALQREWALLHLIWPRLSESLQDTLPRPLLATQVHAVPVFVQSALRGKNLKTLIQRGQRSRSIHQVGEDLYRMERWLQQLEQLEPPAAFPGLQVTQTLSLRRPLEPLIPTLIDAGILTRGQAHGLLGRAEVLELAMGRQSPCWVHGDLWPGNVLIEGSSWHVLDWDGITVGLPWQDRFWFGLHYGMLSHSARLGREDLTEGLRRTLFMAHPISDMVGDYLRRVVRQTGSSEVSPRDYVALMLAIEAGRWLTGQGGRRAFSRSAGVLLRDWMSYPEQVQLAPEPG